LTLTDRRAAALLLVAVAAAYANALPAAFQFDDYNVIVDNPAVHGIGAWAASMPGIRALLKLSYVLNWQSGLGAPGFHAVNVLLHAGNALLVFALMRTVLSMPGLRATDRDGRDTLVALGAALLFALHPAQTEAVTYVSGRSVSMMSAFYLGAALVWLRAPGARSAGWLSAALFACALATRETAWTLPLALLLLARAGGRGWRDIARGLRPHGWVLALFAVAVLSIAGYRRLLIGSISVRTLGDNLVTQIDGVWYLLTGPLLSLQLNIDPDLAAHSALSPALALKGGALLALLLAGFALLGRRPAAGCALLWMFLHLLPTNSVLPRLDVANDRQLYLAMLGPSWLVADAARRLPRVGHALAAVALLAMLLGAHTVLRNGDYRDEVSLWKATAAASPSKPRVWNNLGYAERLAGNTAAARAAFERALALDPDFDTARHNLNALGVR
jgi:protein O-mannosyl-transferase